MKTSLLLCKLCLCFLCSSCATIIGGSNYYAHVEVKDKPQAEIVHNGITRGYGHASFKVKRKEADKLSILIRQDGCPQQSFNYHGRTFRGGAFLCSILFWTGVVEGVPLPWGLVLDLITGAVWKPNVSEMGVDKIDYKNFRYSIDYNNCNTIPTAAKAVSQPQYLDIVFLKNGSIIKGIITETIPNVQIKLQTTDGNLFVLKMDGIEKLTRELVN